MKCLHCLVFCLSSEGLDFQVDLGEWNGFGVGL